MSDKTASWRGLALSAAFYAEVVAPMLFACFPALRYGAGLIGWGSEVRSLDLERSQDHNWEPHLQLFLKDQDLAEVGSDVHSCLAQELPHSFGGFPTKLHDTGL